MIRHILIIPVILLSVNLMLAQPKGVKYNIGPKAALNVYKSRFNFKEDEAIFDQKTKFGFQIGGAFDMPLKKNIHFYTEVYYSMKGKETFIVDAGLTNNATYHFLEAPILVRLSFNGAKVSSGIYKWHVDIGPTVSYWLGGKGTLYSDGPTSEYKIVFVDTPPSTSEFDVMYISQANRWQWGLMAGVGIEYPVYKHQVVFIDLRVGLGGTNLAEPEGSAQIPILGFSDSLDVRFLEFSLSAAYTFQVDWALTKKGKSTVKKRKKS